jgi:hypothetical protein
MYISKDLDEERRSCRQAERVREKILSCMMLNEGKTVQKPWLFVLIRVLQFSPHDDLLYRSLLSTG